MKKFAATLFTLFATVTTSFGQTYFGSSSSVLNGTNPNTTSVRGYTRSNETYVSPYRRTTRNYTNHDNFSTSGNSNPLTGTTGYRARDYSNDAYNYGERQSIHTGSRGGQYYINRNNNRVYVPKRKSTYAW